MMARSETGCPGRLSNEGPKARDLVVTFYREKPKGDEWWRGTEAPSPPNSSSYPRDERGPVGTRGDERTSLRQTPLPETNAHPTPGSKVLADLSGHPTATFETLNPLFLSASATFPPSDPAQFQEQHL